MAAGLLPPISCRPFGTAKLFYHKSYERQTSDRQRHKKQQLDKIMTLGLWISPCCGAGSGYIKNECPEICELQNFRAVYERMLSKLCRTSHHRRSPRPYSYTRIAVWFVQNRRPPAFEAWVLAAEGFSRCGTCLASLVATSQTAALANGLRF
jgi:hypothetical protein